ncbi:MAG: hypothetical protein IPH31_21510 [Lewinellaceae bacterium]|nr:hypothetical protein [Lewinellaceae bacterium]
MDTKQLIVLLCGLYTLGFALFHALFWRIFNWEKELAKLSAPNRAIMQIFNTRIIYLALFVAYVCFFYPDDLLQTRLGMVFLAGFSLFWFGRFLEQFIFLRKVNHWMVHFLTVIFLLGAGLFALPIFL